MNRLFGSDALRWARENNSLVHVDHALIADRLGALRGLPLSEDEVFELREGEEYLNFRQDEPRVLELIAEYGHKVVYVDLTSADDEEIRMRILRAFFLSAARGEYFPEDGLCLEFGMFEYGVCSEHFQPESSVVYTLCLKMVDEGLLTAELLPEDERQKYFIGLYQFKLNSPISDSLLKVFAYFPNDPQTLFIAEHINIDTPERDWLRLTGLLNSQIQ